MSGILPAEQNTQNRTEMNIYTFPNARVKMYVESRM